MLLITSEFPPLPGGIGNHAYLLSKYLQKSDYDVTVLTDYRSEKEDDFFDKQQHFSVTRVKRNFFTYFNRFRLAFLLIKKSETVIASGKFSLWIAASMKLLFPKQKYTAVLHGSELTAGNKLQQHLTKWSLSQFDELIAVSNFTKQVALSLDSSFEIEVINNGIELKEYPNKLVKEEVLNLVTVGNLTFRKGQQNVIKALPLLKEKYKNVHYHCIGIPTEKEKFKALAVSLGVEDVVTFHGALSDVEKENVLQNSTLFIMLSDIVKNDFEGFGIAILEANNMGLPAIGSENSGIADAISSGNSGFLVSPHDPEAIERAIAEILAHYERFSTNAKQRALDFDWNTIVKRYVTVIER